VDVARTEAVEAEITHMIERRSRKGEVDRDQLEPSYAESVRRYNTRLQEERRAAWCEHHHVQAARLRTTVEALIARHEAEAERLAP
jgi:hypothetical protein